MKPFCLQQDYLFLFGTFLYFLGKDLGKEITKTRWLTLKVVYHKYVHLGCAFRRGRVHFVPHQYIMFNGMCNLMQGRARS